MHAISVVTYTLIRLDFSWVAPWEGTCWALLSAITWVRNPKAGRCAGRGWGGIVVRVWSRGMALAKRVLSGEEAAMRIKQFVLYPSTRNERQAEVVDLHLLLTINRWSGSSHHMQLYWGASRFCSGTHIMRDCKLWLVNPLVKKAEITAADVCKLTLLSCYPQLFLWHFILIEGTRRTIVSLRPML